MRLGAAETKVKEEEYSGGEEFTKVLKPTFVFVCAGCGNKQKMLVNHSRVLTALFCGFCRNRIELPKNIKT